MRRAPGNAHAGIAGHGDAAPPVSLPTSQTPSPRRLPPSPRTRDIPRHSKPGATMSCEECADKTSTFASLDYMGIPTSSPLLCAPRREPGPGPRGTHRSPATASPSIGRSTRSKGERRIPGSLPMDATDSPLAESSSNRRSRGERSGSETSTARMKSSGSASTRPCGLLRWRRLEERSTPESSLAWGTTQPYGVVEVSQTGVHSASPPRQRSATRLDGSTEPRHPM